MEVDLFIHHSLLLLSSDQLLVQENFMKAIPAAREISFLELILSIIILTLKLTDQNLAISPPPPFPDPKYVTSN